MKSDALERLRALRRRGLCPLCGEAWHVDLSTLKVCEDAYYAARPFLSRKPWLSPGGDPRRRDWLIERRRVQLGIS